MKMPTTQFTLVATAALCCFSVSCGNNNAPVTSVVADVFRAPFVALGCASSAVRSAPTALAATASSLNQTAGNIGPALTSTTSSLTSASSTLGPNATAVTNSAITRTNTSYNKTFGSSN